MDFETYKAAKSRLGIANPDLWCAALNIAKDTDKSYSSNRLAIPERIALRVREILESRERRVEKLAEKLRTIFEDYSVDICPNTHNIYVASATKEIRVEFINNGVDHFFHDVYSFESKGRTKNLILYYPSKPWEKNPKDYDWYFWRAEPRLEEVRYMQNYHNQITKKLLSSSLGFAI